MKFKKTVLLTDEVITSIENGDTKLQTGQWCKIPCSQRSCRFVGVTKSQSIWFVHPHNGQIQNKRFKMCNKNIKRFQ